jgi:[acyl-carrier-protein] S-malonyltransferase
MSVSVNATRFRPAEGLMTVALFPGQGVQAAGMEAGLASSVPEIFETASDVLGVDVVELCRTGTAGSADLSSTRWAQPTVLTCSVAGYEAVRASGESFVAVVGHSIGEYAALVACGALAFGDALQLVRLRADLTADLAEQTAGAMAAVMRIDLDTVRATCAAGGVALAADNGPGQLVISGDATAVDAVIASLNEQGAACRRLDVAGAFHSPLMGPAAEPLREALEAVTVSAPAIEFWSTTTATQLTDAGDIKGALVDQLVASVRWRETVCGLAERHGTSFVDIGPAKVVGALVRRIVSGPDIRYAADLLSTPAGAA